MNAPNNTPNPIAQLIAAAKEGPEKMAIALEALAIRFNEIHMLNEDEHGLLDQVARTLPPYEPLIHGQTRPGVWVGSLKELNADEGSAEEICGDTVIALFKPLVAEWGDEYRCPTKREAEVLGENYRVLGSSPTSYGDVVVEVEIGTAIKLDRMMKSYPHSLN